MMKNYNVTLQVLLSLVLAMTMLSEVANALNSGGRGGRSRADNDSYEDPEANHAILWVVGCLVGGFILCGVVAVIRDQRKKAEEAALEDEEN